MHDGDSYCCSFIIPTDGSRTIWMVIKLQTLDVRAKRGLTMGGNALKNCVTRRISADEYMTLSAEVILMLDRFNVFSDLPKSYKNKESFGDIDVVYTSNDSVPEFRISESDIREIFHSKEIVRNSNVISFEYKGVQVDLIHTVPTEYTTTLNYLAYNDLGNLLGRIAHKMGFKYGHRGLVYQFRTSDSHMVEEVLVTSTLYRILHFLGYDDAQFIHGFEDIEDIFNYVVSSRFFNKNIYLLENRNSISRTRDKKRKTYNQFLIWLSDKHGFPEYPWGSVDERGVTTNEAALKSAFETFPTFRDRYDVVVAKVEQLELFKSLFNGDKVKEFSGLENEELGKLMVAFKTWGNQRLEGSLQDYILELGNQEKVNLFIKDFIETQKGFNV